MDDRKRFSALIKWEALNEGFDLVGFAPVEPLKRDVEQYKNWINNKMHAEMTYLETQRGKKERLQNIIHDAKSIICCGINYYSKKPPETDYSVARYAWGEDYHNIVTKKLRRLFKKIKTMAPDTDGRIYVDTGPVLERAFAERAGLGWIGKNTMLISKDIGSYFFIGDIITTLELEYDAPATFHCGTCTRCIDGCPTGAIKQNAVLDARQCISYWTIEHRGEIPEKIKSKIGNHLFGCDICQEVCPWNSKTMETKEAAFLPLKFPTLEAIKDMDREVYDEIFKGRAIKRAGIDGLKRNAQIAAS